MSPTSRTHDDRIRLFHWTTTFRAFANRKIAVPLPSGTHFSLDAEHNRG